MIKFENTDVLGWDHAIRGMRNPLNSWDRTDTNYCKYCDTVGDFSPNIGPNDYSLMKRLRNAGTDHRKFMRYIIVYLDITAPLYWWKEFETYRAGVFPGQEPINPMDIEMNSCSTMHTIHKKEFTLDDFSHEHLNIDLMDDNGFIPYKDMLDLVWPSVPADYQTAKSGLRLVIQLLNFYRQRYLETKDKKYWWQMIQLLPSSYNQKRTVMLNYEVLANIYKSRKDHKLDEWRQFCDWIKQLPYSEFITGEYKENSNEAV